jgi:hypothetical protein
MQWQYRRVTAAHDHLSAPFARGREAKLS